MLRASVIVKAKTVIRTGLDRHQWSDAQLAGFEERLNRLDLLPGIALAFRGERGSLNQAFEAFHRMTPDARDALFAGEPRQSLPTYLNDWKIGPIRIPGYLTIFGPGDQAAENRATQRMVEAIDRAPVHGFQYRDAHPDIVGIERFTHFLTLNFVFLLGDQPNVIAMQTVELRQLATACALERYRLRHGEYPAHLADLVPTLLPAVPRDVFTLRPMRYDRLSPTKFHLSAGDVVWNE
jgi:hypothetical protein